MNLVPANSKKGMLMFNIFKQIDLIIFGVGVGFSLLILPFINTNNMIALSITISPALIATILCFPIPNYHNVRVLLNAVFSYLFINRQRYIWKGWCCKDVFK